MLKFGFTFPKYLYLYAWNFCWKPYILWTSRKREIKNINKLGKDLINYVITWTIILFFYLISLFIISTIELINNITLSTFFIVIGFLYFTNLISISLNTFRVSNRKELVYIPHIILSS